VLADLQDLVVRLEPNQKLYMVSSDIVDFYPRIDLDLGLQHVSRLVNTMYTFSESSFILFAIRRILEHKYFRVCVSKVSRGSQVVEVLYLHKLKSLSIGEHIATAFANILRHCLTSEAVQHASVVKHWGYVDDTLSFVVGNSSDVSHFVHTFDNAINPLEWDHDIQCDAQHFLDIQIFAKSIARSDGGHDVHFETTMYRKPSFRPHYLAALSEHPASHKCGIFRCEAFRVLTLCAKQTQFDSCIFQVVGFLSSAGYPSSLFRLPSFSSSRRLEALKKLEGRKPKRSGDFEVTAKLRKSVIMSLPFNAQLDTLGVPKVFKLMFGSIIPIDIKLGWSVKRNSMRRLYRLNWPCAAQKHGNG
jgi:hypothetical protein